MTAHRLSLKLRTVVEVPAGYDREYDVFRGTVDQEVELSAEFDCCYSFEARICEYDGLVVRVDGIHAPLGFYNQELQDAIDARLESEARHINAERATAAKIASDFDRALAMATGAQLVDRRALDREQAGKSDRALRLELVKGGAK